MVSPVQKKPGQKITVKIRDEFEPTEFISHINDPVRFEGGFVIITANVSETEQKHIAFNRDVVDFFSVVPITE